MTSLPMRVRRLASVLLWLAGFGCLLLLTNPRSVELLVWLPYIVMLACLWLHATMHAPVHRRRHPPRSRSGR